MMRRSSFALMACLILAVVVGSVGLSSCGGGGGGSGGAAAPEVVITPSARSTRTVQENGLTGIRVMLQNQQARETDMRITLEPAGAQWNIFDYEIDPINAGVMCCYQSYAESIYITFTCDNGYTGNVTLTFIVTGTNHYTAEEPVTFTCQ